ncbi:MAG: norR 25, partial [Firmicutes bacterium]|nr:norR 25 [Bacillota bacterium]
MLARITGGIATVTDSEGRRLKTVDSHGNEIRDYLGQVYSLAREAAKSQLPLFGPSQFVEQAEAWVLPIGRYVIACSNLERVEREAKLKEALTQALPLIARVAGGEAVLFDQDGRRIDSVDHIGQRNQAFIGKISKAASEAMQQQRPVFGQSMSVPGG